MEYIVYGDRHNRCSYGPFKQHFNCSTIALQRYGDELLLKEEKEKDKAKPTLNNAMRLRSYKYVWIDQRVV